MSPLWMFMAPLIVAAGALVLMAARRVHDEIGPTIASFHEFRDAIRPRVVALRVETDTTRARISRADTEPFRRF